MPRFNINGTWIDAANYAAARQQYAVQHPPVQAQVPVAQAPLPVTVTAVLTPRAAFNGRSLVRFGIGEVVDLSFTTTNPPNQTAASFGGLTWVVTAGNNLVTLVNDGGNTGTGHFTCKSEAGPVKLELRTVGGQTKASRQFMIVRPSGAHMALANNPNTGQPYGTYHVSGVPSAGFKGAIYLDPRDVSFANTELREGAANYEGTGIFQRGEVSQAELAVSYDTIHPVLGAWVRMNAGDSALTGSRCVGTDTVSTETTAIGQGTFTWTIPWLVRVVGSNEEIRVFEAVHSVTTDALGNMTISKAGVVVQKNIGAATSNY
jgi:hypothetical protein